jgi:hypothetical protein
MRRLVATMLTVCLLLSLVAVSLVFSLSRPAVSTPVALSPEEYQVLGRIWPDPHAGQAGAPGKSPYAKGNVPAVDFMQMDELKLGLRFLDKTFPQFVRVFRLHKDFKCSGEPATDPSQGCKAFKSAGLPVTMDENGETYVREKRPLWMVRITDEESPIPLEQRKHFVFPLSIHGIERAGVEGGIRAAEDLATWGACEAGKAPEYVDCEGEKTGDDPDKPYPLLEATPQESVGAGEALRESAVFFMMPNPDGWLRGDRFRDRVPGTSFYQRYNGNGVDLNRDWPEQGYTFRPYTPASEPETRSFVKVLRELGPKDAQGRPQWTGGIDLHGQLIDRAFSFTLIGGSQRPYDKNQRVLQTVKGAWADAEERLAWSPLIKPNDAPDQPADPRVWGVQWGTIWDTIDYTVTGALGNWIDSPIGLNADGIDNEMSTSHLINCGVGSCFSQDLEQLHVDGNKSLVYSMINFSLKKESHDFETKGRVGYIHNPGFIEGQRNPLEAPPKFAQLPPQKGRR